jgi:hypothetical protein
LDLRITTAARVTTADTAGMADTVGAITTEVSDTAGADSFFRNELGSFGAALLSQSRNKDEDIFVLTYLDDVLRGI